MAPSINARNLEWHLLVPAFLLGVISLVLIASLHGAERAFLQGVWLALSGGALAVILAIDYRSLTRISVLLYPMMLIALIAVLFTPAINGAHSWFRAGRISLQPSEFVKPVLILTLAAYLSFRDFHRSFWGLFPPLLFTLIPFALVILQPDLGTAALFIPIFFVVIIIAGAKMKHVLLLIILALILMPAFYPLLKEHQKKRIQAFLRPGEFTRSVGRHLEHSKIAIGAGGMTGYEAEEEDTEPHMSFIVYAATDYAFSVVAEKFGFIGSVIVLLLYLWIIFGSYRLLLRMRDPVGQLIIAGATALIAAQACLHIGGNLQLMPFTGVPTPFLSYGGSSVMSSAICLGLILNVGLRWRPVLGDESSSHR